MYPDSAESFLPGVCKELIGSSLELLGQSDDEENTVADNLISNFLKIHDGILAVSRAHEEQDEDSQSNGEQPLPPAHEHRGSLLRCAWLCHLCHAVPGVTVFHGDQT